LTLIVIATIALFSSVHANNRGKLFKILHDKLKEIERVDHELSVGREGPLLDVKPARESAPVDPHANIKPGKRGPILDVKPAKTGPRPFAELQHNLKHANPFLENFAENKKSDFQTKWGLNVFSCALFGFGCDDNDNDEDDDDVNEDDDTSSSTSCRTDVLCGDLHASKIVNGHQIDITTRPWQIFLLIGPSSEMTMCGGSIVSKNWIITAAHCIDGKTESDLSIYAGHSESPLQDYYNTPVTRTVSQIIIHEQYNHFSKDNDIALLKLSSPLDFGSGIQPICMPTSATVPDAGTTCAVTGWGATSSGGAASPTLLEVSVPILSDCGDNSVTEHMICAGYQEGGEDACQGDSGGPLACKHNNAYYLDGVVSFGTECALPNYPGVYTKVASYIGNNWLNDKLNGDCYTRS